LARFGEMDEYMFAVLGRLGVDVALFLNLGKSALGHGGNGGILGGRGLR